MVSAIFEWHYPGWKYVRRGGGDPFSRVNGEIYYNGVLCALALRKTVTGATIIAMAQNRDGAALVGIDANRVAMMTFAISGVLAAVAATLYAPINLVIIVLGGMGSVPGAILGGLIIGFAESFGAFYISTDYKDIIAFVLLVVVLSVRPQGLFTTGAR